MLRAFAFAVFTFILVEPAMADAIDGDWCGEKGLRLSIKGPEITTPSGAKLLGNYHRHNFDYSAPAGDADAGLEIHLQLLSEEYMNFTRMKDGKSSEPELWRRCEVIS